MLIESNEEKWHLFWQPRSHHVYKMEYLEKISFEFKK